MTYARDDDASVLGDHERVPGNGIVFGAHPSGGGNAAQSVAFIQNLMEGRSRYNDDDGNNGDRNLVQVRHAGDVILSEVLTLILPIKQLVNLLLEAALDLGVDHQVVDQHSHHLP